jgi:photosystem II stability/assembly factor-like uncharacterized protein
VYSYAIAIDPVQTNILYLGYLGCCYRSTDNGANWNRYYKNIYGVCNHLIAFSSSQTQIYYGSYAGIFKSTDQSMNWNSSHSGILANQIPALAIAPSTSNIVFAEASGNGFFKSTDYGSSWRRMPDFYRCDAVTKIVVNQADPDSLFILAGG